MKPEVEEILRKVKDTADFGYVDFTHINATNAYGDNALHCVIVWGDVAAARLLIENGININQPGEHGYTPLHQACSFGSKEIVALLLEKGADPFARTEGNQPFTLARMGGYDDICELISTTLKGKPDPSRRAEAQHMDHLRKSIADLERQVRECAEGAPNPPTAQD